MSTAVIPHFAALSRQSHHPHPRFPFPLLEPLRRLSPLEFGIATSITTQKRKKAEIDPPRIAPHPTATNPEKFRISRLYRSHGSHAPSAPPHATNPHPKRPRAPFPPSIALSPPNHPRDPAQLPSTPLSPPQPASLPRSAPTRLLDRTLPC
jgi:hypothetical protein